MESIRAERRRKNLVWTAALLLVVGVILIILGYHDYDDEWEFGMVLGPVCVGIGILLCLFGTCAGRVKDNARQALVVGGTYEPPPHRNIQWDHAQPHAHVQPPNYSAATRNQPYGGNRNYSQDVGYRDQPNQPLPGAYGGASESGRYNAAFVDCSDAASPLSQSRPVRDWNSQSTREHRSELPSAPVRETPPPTYDEVISGKT